MEKKKLIRILGSQTNTAFTHFAIRHSVGLALYSKNKLVEKIGSGTLLSIGPRYFITTAAHCLRGRKLSTIRIAYRDKDYTMKFSLIKKGGIGGAEGDPLDVGYIEVKKNIDDLPVEFLTIDHIAIDYDFAESVAFLFGFPAELVPRDDIENGLYGFRSLSFMTVEAPDSLIPQFIEKTTDIVLKYPEFAQSGLEIMRKLPSPCGISGGSIWIYDPNLENPIAGIHNARYIGIQRAWLKSSGLVIGNRIVYLLKLIANDYADLNELLINHFDLT